MIEKLPGTVRLGARFHLHGARHEISFVSRANVRFAACEGGKPRNVPAPAFIKLIDDGLVLMVDDNGDPITSTRTRCLERLSDSQLCEMHKRRRYVQEALSAAHPCSKQNLIKTIDRITEQEAKEAEDGKSISATCDVEVEPGQHARPSKAPSTATLARWVKRFVAAARDPLSLVSDSDRRGPRFKRLPEEVEAIIADVISSDYLTTQKASGVQTYCKLVERILAAPRLTSSPDIELPSQRTLLRRIAEIDPYLKTLLRYGRKRADAEFKPAGARSPAIRPMQRVYIDGHLMDVVVIDSRDKKTRYRPRLVALIDDCTRSLVGYNISLLPFCSATALAALKDMCCRDPRLGPGGEAELIIPDNGPDLRSAGLTNLLKRTGMHFEPAEAYDPNGKAILERFFKTVNTQFSHLLPGTTFSSPEDRGDYDSSEKGCLELENVRMLFKQWVDTVYHCGVHGGTQRVPKLHWQELQAAFPVHSYKRQEIDVIARVGYERTISSGRVEVDYLFWKSAVLASWEQSGERDVIVMLDELDYGKAYVHRIGDPANYVQADPVYPEYMRNLTRYEHEASKKLTAVTRSRDLASVGEHTWLLARAQLWNDINRLASAGMKKLKALLQGSPAPGPEPITDEGRERIDPNAGTKTQGTHATSDNSEPDVDASQKARNERVVRSFSTYQR